LRHGVRVVVDAREEVEVIATVEVAAERAARQLILEAIIEPAVADKQLRLAIAEDVERATDARRRLRAPIELDARIACAEGRDIFTFETHAQVERQTRSRL